MKSPLKSLNSIRSLLVSPLNQDSFLLNHHINSLQITLKSPFFPGKSPLFPGKSPFFLGKSPLFPGKSPFFLGKSQFFLGKSPLCSQVNHHENPPCPVSRWNDSATTAERPASAAPRPWTRPRRPRSPWPWHGGRPAQKPPLLEGSLHVSNKNVDIYVNILWLLWLLSISMENLLCWYHVKNIFMCHILWLLWLHPCYRLVIFTINGWYHFM